MYVSGDDAVRSRRFRLIMIEDHVMLNIFGLALQDYPHAVKLPVLKDVPPDVIVLNVEHRLEFRAFLLLLAHPSFDAVPMGNECPLHSPVMEYITIALPPRSE